MLSINIYLKFALIALFLGGGIALSFVYGIGYSLILIIIGLLLLASYFLLGTVQSASQFIQLQNFGEAEKRLNLTFFPNLLYVTNRSIFYVLKGTMALQKGNSKDGEDWFQKALTLKLPSDNETGMVLLQLASIQAQKNNWAGAKNYMQRIKKLKITEPMIKQQMDHLDKAFESRGNVNVARSMGKQGMQMMQKGGLGKRRRPIGR